MHLCLLVGPESGRIYRNEASAYFIESLLIRAANLTYGDSWGDHECVGMESSLSLGEDFGWRWETLGISFVSRYMFYL